MNCWKTQSRFTISRLRTIIPIMCPIPVCWCIIHALTLRQMHRRQRNSATDQKHICRTAVNMLVNLLQKILRGMVIQHTSYLNL